MQLRIPDPTKQRTFRFQLLRCSILNLLTPFGIVGQFLANFVFEFSSHLELIHIFWNAIWVIGTRIASKKLLKNLLRKSFLFSTSTIQGFSVINNVHCYTLCLSIGLL